MATEESTMNDTPTRDDELARAARDLLMEIDARRGLKVGCNGILDRLHPICIFAEHLRTALQKPAAGVFVIMEGGLCQEVVANDERLVGLPCTVIDYDSDSFESLDEFGIVPQEQGHCADASLSEGKIGRATIKTADILWPEDFERAARVAGWTREGDGDGVIYNTKHHESWKAAASDPDYPAYVSWRECCDANDIDVTPQPR
jgi:hypothetical protein